MPWLLGLFGLLALLPAPELVSVLASVLASVAMIVAGLVNRSRGGLARYNGLKAADWGLTYLLATIVLYSFAASMEHGVDPSGAVPDFSFIVYLFYIALVLMALMSVFHVAYCIYAGVCAQSGRRVGFSGIPFFSRGLGTVA